MNKEQKAAIDYLHAYKSFLTRQQFKTLRGQCFTDARAARKGLVKIIKRNGLKAELGRW